MHGIFPILCTLLVSVALSGRPLPCGAAAAETAKKDPSGFAVSPDFSSGVPILLLDFGANGAQDINDMSGENIAAAVLAGKDGPNRLDDQPALTLRLHIEREQSGGKKGSYRLALSDKEKQAGTVELLGLPPDTAWSLRGSDRDKTMLRNAIGPALAARMRPDFAPQALFCEVVAKRGASFTYQGVYLLSEYIADGVLLSSRALADKTDIARPAAREGGLDYTAVSAPGLDAGRQPEVFRQTEAGLYSDVNAEFFAAFDTLDMDSFIDTYLLYNWMLNYIGEPLPFYLFRRSDGLIGASPLWYFDGALDNTVKPPEELTMRDDMYPWFNRLLLDSTFIAVLQERFFRLSRETLSTSAIEVLVENTAESLGPAFARDWARWGGAYEAIPLESRWSDDLHEIIRRTSTPTEELIKVKCLLRENGMSLRPHMETLRWKEVPFTENKREGRVTVKTLAFIAAFFTAVFVARRRM